MFRGVVPGWASKIILSTLSSPTVKAKEVHEIPMALNDEVGRSRSNDSARFSKANS